MNGDEQGRGLAVCSRPNPWGATVKKILVIDDSSMMRLLLRDYLEMAKYEVEAWLPMSAMEIPDHIRESNPDLVLTDFIMPGVNGLSVAQMTQRANPDIPVVVLTAQRDPEMEAKLLKFGVRCVLAKPIKQDTLLSAIKEILG